MISSFAKLPDIVILSGQTNSNVVTGQEHYHDAVGLCLFSPAVLAEAVHFEFNPDPEATNASSGWEPYETFDVSGSSVNLLVPGAGKVQVYQQPLFAPAFRLTSGGAVAADRVFKISKIYTI